MSEQPEAAQPTIPREEVARVLQDAYTRLYREMRADLMGVRAIQCSSELYLVDSIARKLGIAVQKPEPDL